MKKKRNENHGNILLTKHLFPKKTAIYKSFAIFKNPNYIFNNRVSNKIELYIQQFFPTYIIYTILGLK